MCVWLTATVLLAAPADEPSESRKAVVAGIAVEVTYQDAAAGVPDGGLFAFAYGTNPKLMLFVEAQADGGKPAWRFAVARSSFAELHLACDDKEDYSAPRGHRLSGPDKPFWTSVLEVRP